MKKYRLTTNLGLKIMALVFAAFLWLIVVNVDDPVETGTFRNVPVTIKNASVITNAGRTYTVLDDTQSVSVVVKAKRSLLSKITVSDIEATADMSEMQMETLVPITATVRGYEGKYTAETTPRNLKVKTDDETSQVFPLNVSVTGTPRDGYVIDESQITTDPEKVTVSGPKTQINSIHRAVAQVDVTGISESGILDAELVFFDGNGNPVNNSQLDPGLGDEGVKVNIPVLNTKNVSLHFDVSGTAAEGHVYSGLTCEPKEVQVCGTEEVLAEFTQLDIPGSEIDISGATEKVEKTVNIQPYLPEGIRLVDETAGNVVVTVTIEQEGARTIELPVGAIRVKNLVDNLEISYESKEAIELQFKGPEQMLQALDLTNAVSIDMKTHKKPGTFDVTVDVVLDEKIAASVTLTKNPVLKVTLTEKEDTSDTTNIKEAEDE